MVRRRSRAKSRKKRRSRKKSIRRKSTKRAKSRRRSRRKSSCSYRITQYSKNQAKKYKVQIKPSTNTKKKLDVYKNGKKIASVGAKCYGDYPTFIKSHGLAYAKRRERHTKKGTKDRHKKGSNDIMQINYYGELNVVDYLFFYKQFWMNTTSLHQNRLHPRKIILVFQKHFLEICSSCLSNLCLHARRVLA